jgi:hypothetical protein
MGCWRTINGNRVYIENCFEPWKATVIVTVALVAGGTTAAGAGSVVSGPGVSVTADVGVRVNLKARDRNSRSVRVRLERRGLRIRARHETADIDCAAHSYGEVQQWFREHPCQAMYRALFEVDDGRSGLALVAVAWVDMPDVAGAMEFTQLVDRHGTGNITELSRERGLYRDVRFDGEHYASRREDTTVVNAQVQPIGRTARAVELAELARTAVG